MKKTYNLFWTGLLVVSLLLAGCQQPTSNIPADPVEAIKTIADKQKDIKSQHLDLSIDLGLQADGFQTDSSTASIAALFKNFKASVTATGDVDGAKNDFQFNGSADLGPFTAFLAQGEDKLTFDLVKVGDTLYSRAAGQDWSSSPFSASTSDQGNSNESSNNVSPAQLSELLKKTTKAERLGDESIDGTDSYHFKVTLDPVALINELSTMAAAADPSAKVDQQQLDEAQKLLKDSAVDVEVWVGKSDLFVRQEKIHLNFNLKDIPDQPGASALIDLLINAKISKINEPVTITAPQ